MNTSNTEWQHMDSAPKDGTPILGYAYGDLAVVSWTQYTHNLPENYWYLTVCGQYAQDGEWWPVLWQPLPPAPNAESIK